MENVRLKDAFIESLFGQEVPGKQAKIQNLRDALLTYDLIRNLGSVEGVESLVQKLGTYCVTATQTIDSLEREEEVPVPAIVDLQRAYSVLHTLMQARVALDLANVQWDAAELESEEKPTAEVGADNKAAILQLAQALEFTGRLLIAPRLRRFRDHYDKGQAETRQKLQEIIDEVPKITAPVLDVAAGVFGGLSALAGSAADLFSSKKES